MKSISYVVIILFNVLLPLIAKAGEGSSTLNKQLIVSSKVDSARVQYVSLKDTSITNFVKKWINILEKKDPYFKDRGVLRMRFNRFNKSVDTLGFYSLTVLYSYKDLVKDQSSIPIFYSIIQKRYILIEADPVLTQSLAISVRSLNEAFKKMKDWFRYPHTFIVVDSITPGNFKKELVGKAQGDAGELSLIRSEYTPALIIRKNLPPISTGFSVYGWGK